MDNQVKNLFKSVKNGKTYYRDPKNFEVTHRLDDVNDLRDLADEYDLILLDRDCTLQHYHGTERVPEFEETLQKIAYKSEIISNSSFGTFLGIGDIYGFLFPANKLVRLSRLKYDHLLRVDDEGLRVFSYLPGLRMFYEDTCGVMIPDGSLRLEIEHNYDKPDPLVVTATIDWNIFNGKVSSDPKVLMVGDKYLTDIVAGNLAGVHTARVKPYKPTSDPLHLWPIRLIDSSVGTIMSRHDELDL
tara:strand:+ start:145 stop:876 length:732 start_codon:yes stop_codon:yes gene_type:complete